MIIIRCERATANCRSNRAGVVGLDVALLLAERGYGSHITVIAEHLPGDTSINYTSPWYINTTTFYMEIIVMAN
jgi:glycine/D-amino acid oxidase-like deaminating enzyme